MKRNTPAESTPAESTPAESTPAESTPAESTPAESTPAESTPAESTPTILLTACYNLTNETLKKTTVSPYGFSDSPWKRQYIAVTLDKDEAIRTGYARKIWSPDLDAEIYDRTDFILCKLKPNLAQLGVEWGSVLPEFDHILSKAEATEMIEKEMARYDKVLGVSRAAYDKRANANTVMITLTGIYSLTEEAHRELFLAGTPTTREQHVNVTVSAREALRTGYLHLDKNGQASPAGSAGRLFSKMTPGNESVLREGNAPPEFDHVLTAEEATKLIVDEMARYDEVLAEAMKTKEAVLAEGRSKTSKEERKRREEIDELMTNLDYYLPKIKEGEPCVIDPDHDVPEWFEMDDERVSLRYDFIEEESGEDQVDKTMEFLISERKKRADEPILGWIKEHGSSRLQKAVFEAKILDQVRELYHDERLAHELPDWMPLKSVTTVREDPTESEIDALILARKKWPDGNVELRLIGLSSDDPNWAPALIMRCPWNKNNVVALRMDVDCNRVNEPPKESEGASLEEFYENLPAGSILLDWRGIPIRILKMKGLDASGEMIFNNGQADQNIDTWSGHLRKEHYRLIIAEHYRASCAAYPT
jgi:hypothetical protein